MKTTMMMKMGKLVLLTALVTAIALPSMAFADQKKETPVTPREKIVLGEKAAPRENAPKANPTEKITQKFDEKRQAIEAKKEDRKGEQEARQMQFRTKMTEIITVYAADLLDEFEGSWATLDGIREDLRDVHEQIRTKNMARNEAFMIDIRTKVQAGTMTKDEAKVAIQAFRATNEAERKVVRDTIEAMKLAAGITPEAHEALHDALMAAVEAKDAVAVKAALVAILDGLQDHIDFEQAKLAYLSTLI